jgi:dipeptidyl-peptidase 4
MCVAVAILATTSVVVPFAQQNDRAAALDAQIGRIFQANEYASPRFGPARWLADGGSYTTVERGDIVRYNAVTGQRTVFVPSARLVPPGATAALAIDDYIWSKDASRLLVFTNTKKVWRQNTRGDYWVLDVLSGRLMKLGGGAPASTLMFAKFSPDGNRVAYVRANNIYVERIFGDGATEGDGSGIVALTRDGSDTIVNGTSDWVYEEELNVRDAFRWSPDGAHIAFWQFDTSGVGSFSLINDTDTPYPVVTVYRYPLTGTTNSAVRIGVVPSAGGETRWMSTPGDPRDDYLARVEWLDPRTLAIEQINRLQNRNDLLLAAIDSGEVRRVFRDESKTWVELMDEVPWVEDGRAFLWLSERDGWQHVYRIPREGGDPRLLTHFAADALDIAGVDETAGWLYIIASPENATQRYLYRTKLDGSGVPERVTPQSDSGTHQYDVAPGGRLAFHTVSRFDRPPSTDVVALASHRSLRSLTDSTALVARLAPLVDPPVDFFTVDIGSGVVLDGWMLKPRAFDPSRKYPVIVYVYGEPAGQTVVDSWGGGRTLFHRALAEAGYIVLSVDNRGTPAPKGAAWRKVIYGTVGVLSSEEQAAAVRVLATRFPFIDRQRVGVWGWSGGGSNTLNMMFRYPDVFSVGVSVAPVPDQQLYDTIYQERYMGTPQDNPEGYRLGSPINFAAGLRGHLLIAHGSGDDNVHFQGTERLVNRLIELGKPFEMMEYPNRTHAIAEGPGTTVHIYKLVARYFLEHLN